MDDALFTRLAMLALTLVLGSLGLAFPVGANAKIDCEERHQGARVDLEGLPAAPEVARTYTVTADLPSGSGANPRPLLFALRCERYEYEPGNYQLRGTGSAKFGGRKVGEGGYAFDVRFRSPGRWLIASMDVGGRFSDFGFYKVGPEASTLSPEEGSALAPVLIGAGGLAAAAGLALAVWRRRSRRGEPSSQPQQQGWSM